MPDEPRQQDLYPLDEQPRAKTLGPLPLSGAPPQLVPARMVNEVLYCERLVYLEWAQGEFADNFFTVEGRAVTHRQVDARSEPLAEPDEAGRSWTARSVWLSSERLGLTGKLDIVEADDDGRVAPVEYKRGKKPKLAEGAWLPERAQLCAQVLLLREHGYQCDEAWIWFAASREKVAIAITPELTDQTLAAIARVREVTRLPIVPAPLVNDPKCRGCSLAGICLPDELRLLSLIDDPTTTSSHQAIEGARTPARRLQPPNDVRTPVYVQESGATVGVQKQRLRIRLRDGTETFARIPNTSQVCLYGNVQVSTQAMRALYNAGIPIAFFTTGGWFIGRTVTNDTKNIELKVAQYRAHLNDPWRTKIATSLIENKILNQRTQIRRNVGTAPPTTLNALKHLARKAINATSRKSLLGIEGTAARTYFASFSDMVKGDDALRRTFEFTGRNRRPPRDPINALLSLAYALLTKDWTLTLHLAGLEPLLGFFHEPRFGRPALALDLMEPFRPIIADSTVLTLINNGEVTANDFVTSTTGCMLKPSARKKLIAAYERRMAHEISHPIFDYRISYRRTLEVQARLLGRHLLGEVDHYPQFRTR